MHRGDTRSLIALNRAAHIHDAAIAIIGIGNQRQTACLGDASGVVDHLAHREQSDIGHAKTHGGGACAGHVNRLEAMLGH